ncbi:MAG: Fic family protein [Candidatus Onthovivens sp.]|nr:Fic family protein [Candidatus Onthovivens sp.]
MRKFDYSNLKNKAWDSVVINKIAHIHEAKGRQELYLAQKPEELNKLVDLAKIQSTEASNAIEGIRTTDTRLKKIVNEKTTPKNRSEKEIAGYRDALNTIHESFEYIPLTPNYILQLHQILYSKNDEISYGGKFKNVQNYISATDEKGNSFTIFTPLSPYETPMAIQVLCDEYNKAIEKREVDPLILIPIFIHDFLCIHPFNDGNGRMSRLLTTLLLYRSGYYIGKYISLELKISELKDLYYDALYDSQIGWYEENDDSTPFVSYLLSVISMAYDDFENRVEMITKKLSAYDTVKKVLDMKIGKVTKSEVAELCPLLSLSSIEKALAKMVEEGKLEKGGSGKNSFYIIKL